MDTMLAGRFHLDSKKFVVEATPVPVPGPGEVLIEVKAAGVCLSDVHLIDGTLVPQFATSDVVTVGHEVSGVIHTLGPDLKRGLTVGTRVTLEAGKTCGQCADCARRRPCTQMRTAGIDYDGGWAQYTIAREDTLIPIPDNLPFDQAAIIPDAVSTPTPPSSPPRASDPPNPSASGALAESARTTCASPAWSAPRRSSPSTRCTAPAGAPWNSARTSPWTRPPPTSPTRS